MRKFIHGQTIKKYLKDCYCINSEIKSFTDNAKNETNYVVYSKQADLALFAEKEDGTLICINSSGEAVSPDNIFVHAKETDVQVENGEISFQTDKLKITLDGEEMDLYYVKSLEEKIYPERTSIVLNGMLQHNNFKSMPERFYVDEVIYADDKQFDEIQQGRDSDLLKAYNEKHYGTVQDGKHGVLVIRESGDGLLVDTQGYDYARYMAYAPQVGMAIDNMLDREFSQKAIYEMKLYVPLRIVEREVEFGERYDIDGGIYFDKIRDTVRRDDIQNEKRGLAEYLSKKNICQKKVYSIKPDVERVNDVMMGVVAIKMTEPLSQGEIDDLKDYITGQFSDGWGESFEQQAIQIDGNQIYVHFWNSEEYFIKTEEEMAAEQEQEIEMDGMQGMQGMSDMSGM